jgi:pimeloyl-ACP methyl ester carboxylesterase
MMRLILALTAALCVAYRPPRRLTSSTSSDPSMVASPPRSTLAKGVLLLALAALSVLFALPSAARAGVRVPTLDWAPCPDRERFDCATARVPLDYRDPGGSRIRLAVIRHRATKPSRRIGTAFFSPGGPAAAKPLFPTVVEGLLAPVRRRFDVISWDPRGLGESTAVRCFASPAAEDRFFAGVGKPALTFPVGPFEMSRWIERYRAFGQRCRRRSGDLMRHITTAESARDMDLLRRAVGARRVTFIGGSWGTFLGATYANMFPRRVRAMALSAILDPIAWVNRGRDVLTDPAAFAPTYLRQRIDLSARKTLDAFLDLCGRQPVARCAFSAGSAAATRAKFDALLGRLESNPSSASVTYGDFVGTVVNDLYVSSGWGELARKMQSVWTTGSTEGVAAEAPFPDIGGAFGINCTDSPNPGPAAFPRFDPFTLSRAGAPGRFWLWATEVCSTWPVTAPARYTGPWDRRTASPVLVITTTHDPATSYEAAVALSRELARGRLLTVDGYGHGTKSACTDRHLARYLIKRILPPRGARCRGEQPFSPAD